MVRMQWITWSQHPSSSKGKGVIKGVETGVGKGDGVRPAFNGSENGIGNNLLVNDDKEVSSNYGNDNDIADMSDNVVLISAKNLINVDNRDGMDEINPEVCAARGRFAQRVLCQVRLMLYQLMSNIVASHYFA